MATIQIVLNTKGMLDGYNYSPLGKWSTSATAINIRMVDGYDYPSIGKWNSQVKVLELAFQDGKYQGYFLNWGGFGMGAVGSCINYPYQGYSTNWDIIDNMIGGLSAATVDVNSLKDLPKDKTIFYKLRGYNPITEEFEVWVISENITTRPEIFNPGNHPSNRENTLYYTPPSGNQLNDIVIVARWLHQGLYRDWETDRKSTRLNSSHSGESRMPSSA